jgi:hypothetical protein
MAASFPFPAFISVQSHEMVTLLNPPNPLADRRVVDTAKQRTGLNEC